MKLEELLSRLEKFLREERGITGYPSASRDRDLRKKELEDIWRSSKAHLARRRLLDETEARLIRAEPEKRPILEDLLAFLNATIPAPAAPAAPIVSEIRPSIIIGRVSPTRTTPSRATGFAFWGTKEAELVLGEVITAESPKGIRVVGVIHNLETTGPFQNPVEHSVSYKLGDPNAELPTQLYFTIAGEAGVVWRSDDKAAPPEEDWPLRRARADEIRLAFSGGIPKDFAVPAGFVKTPGGFVPVDMDARFIVGYEGGHINIAGITGVAAKTSYGLFITYNILALNHRSPKIKQEGGIAVIAFNVKEVDLMNLEKLPDWEKLPGERAEDKAMWNQLRESYKVEPRKVLRGLRYFAPGVQGGIVMSLRKENIIPFSYGWLDIRDEYPQAFYSLFDPEDLDEKAIAVLEALLRWKGGDSPATFAQLYQELINVASSSKAGDWVSIGKARVHRSTLWKIINRLSLIKEQTSGLLEWNNPSGEKLPIESLKPGDLWVIDITQIGDKARRFLFHTVVATVDKLLRERKAGQRTDFPGRVPLFVDELNRFAPAGRGHHPTRGWITEITTRGRSYGLVLIGLNQLASQIDREVLNNTNTFVVGRSHSAELGDKAYGWMPRTLKEEVMSLAPGTMLVFHPRWRQPVLLRFPRPPHILAREITE